MGMASLHTLTPEVSQDQRLPKRQHVQTTDSIVVLIPAGHSLASCSDLPAAAKTALMKAARTPAFSSSCTAVIVVPVHSIRLK